MKRIRICAAVAAALLAQQALAQSTASSTSSSSASPSSNANSTGNVQSNTFGSTNNTNSSSSANQSASASSTNSQNNGSASTLNANITVVNPGPSAASAAQSSVPADGVMKQSVTGESYSYGEQRTYVEYGGTQTIKNVPSIAAAPLASSNDTCMGSASGGLALAGFGLTGAGTYVDEHCKRIKMSRELWNKGMKAASLAMDCMDRDAREALELTGYTCPQTTRAQRLAEEAGLKHVRSSARDLLATVPPPLPAEEWAFPPAAPVVAASEAAVAAPAAAVAEAARKVAEAAPKVAEAAPVAVATPVRIAPEPERSAVAALPQEANVVVRRVDDGATRGLR